MKPIVFMALDVTLPAMRTWLLVAQVLAMPVTAWAQAKGSAEASAAGRQPQFGTRQYLTDEEFAARAKARQSAQDVDDARTGLFRDEEGTRAFGYTSMVSVVIACEMVHDTRVIPLGTASSQRPPAARTGEDRVNW